MLTESIVFIALLIAAYCDLKTREVPDWLNYGLIAAGLGFAAIKSVISWSYWPLAYSLMGLAVFVALACLMFYSAQWGGGDSKLLMGLGAIFGLKFGISAPFVVFDQMIIGFLVNLLFVAVIYGVTWSAVMAVVKRKLFLPRFKKDFERFKVFRYAVLGIAVLGLIFLYFSQDFLVKVSIVTFVLILFTTFYLWLFVKAVENSCMFKLVSPEKLTEGDWIAKEIRIGKKLIAGPKDLGISKEQIKELLKLKRQKGIKKILIKEGIPFVPSFLIAYIISLVWGNLVLLFI